MLGVVRDDRYETQRPLLQSAVDALDKIKVLESLWLYWKRLSRQPLVLRGSEGRERFAEACFDKC